MSADKLYWRRINSPAEFMSNNNGVITRQTQSNWSTWQDSVDYGVNDPKWRSKIRAGEGVITSLLGYRGSVSYPKGVANYSQGNSSRRMTGMIMGYPGREPDSISMTGLSLAAATGEAKSLAAVRFAKSYRKKTRQWQSGVFAGEIFQAARMLASPARSLRSAVSLLSDKAYKASRKALAGKTLAQVRKMPAGATKRQLVIAHSRAVSDTYLEWVYGLKPTFKDAIDAATAFRAMASGRTFDTVRCGGEADATAAIFDPNLTWVAGSSWSSHPDYTCSRSRSFKAYYEYQGAWKNQNPSQLMPLPNTFGMRALDLLPTTWELIPWSFLVDYFVNVGDVLDAWQMRFVTFSWVIENTRELRTQINHPPPPSFTGTGVYPVRIDCRSPALVLKMDKKSRVKGSSTFDTEFLVKIPGMGTKWVNIAALTSSLLIRGQASPRIRR